MLDPHPELTDSQLETALADLTGTEPPPVAAEQHELVPEAAPAEAPDAKAPEPPPDPEPDWRALAEQRERELAEARAHGNRLAGRIGFYENRIKELATGQSAATVSTADDVAPVEDHTDTEYLMQLRADEAERIAVLEAKERARESERLQQIDSREAAIAEERLRNVDPEVRSKLETEWSEAYQRDVASETDPAMRAVAAKTFFSQFVTMAHAQQYERTHGRLTERRAESLVEINKAKKASTISGSGGSAPPPPPKRSFADMSADEADAWLRENAR